MKQHPSCQLALSVLGKSCQAASIPNSQMHFYMQIVTVLDTGKLTEQQLAQKEELHRS